MEILARYGKDSLATLYIARFRGGETNIAEMVESVQPPFPRSEKWVLIVSSGFGCPVRCAFCDAGSHFHGWLSAEEILAQIDYLVENRFGNGSVPVRKFKVQFARMGEPALNPAIIDVLGRLPARYHAPGLTPCISTVAPEGADTFFEDLIHIKDRYYPGGNFRLQFSIHSTDPRERLRIIPRRKWSLERIADYGQRFFRPGDAKICLNFALAEGVPISADRLGDVFDPGIFMIKITPVNPTDRARRRRFVSLLEGGNIHPAAEAILSSIRERGFDLVESVGEIEENAIGTNCGQMASRFIDGVAEDSLPYQTADYRLSI